MNANVPGLVQPSLVTAADVPVGRHAAATYHMSPNAETPHDKQVWYRALTYSIGKSGTAFIKWGQWSSTRPDMFPEGLCESLSVLHKGAPSHKLAHTKVW